MYPNFETELEALHATIAARTAGHRTDALVDKAVLRRLMLSCLEAKAPYRELLGLGEDFRAFQEVDAIDILTDSPLFQSLASYLNLDAMAAKHGYRVDRRGGGGYYPLLDDAGKTLAEAITANQITLKGRTLRFSRWLNKVVDWDFFRERFVRYDCPPAAKASLEGFLASLFDVSANLRKALVVSFNPLDMLLASEPGGFTSCHGLLGSHVNGNLCYAKTPTTGIVFSTPTNQTTFPFWKLGRMWLYLDGETELRFLLGRVFGTFTEEQVTAVGDWIAGKLSAAKGAHRRLWNRRGAPGQECSGGIPVARLVERRSVANNGRGANAIYFDTPRRLLFHSRTKPRPGRVPVSEMLWPLVFETAHCLCCDRPTDASAHLVCGTCYDKAFSCARCQRSLLRDDKHAWRPNERRQHFDAPGLGICLPCVEALAAIEAGFRRAIPGMVERARERQEAARAERAGRMRAVGERLVAEARERAERERLALATWGLAGFPAPSPDHPVFLSNQGLGEVQDERWPGETTSPPFHPGQGARTLGLNSPWRRYGLLGDQPQGSATGRFPAQASRPDRPNGQPRGGGAAGGSGGGVTWEITSSVNGGAWLVFDEPAVPTRDERVSLTYERSRDGWVTVRRDPPEPINALDPDQVERIAERLRSGQASLDETIQALHASFPNP